MKLHLGCGKRKIPDFYHMDQWSYPHVDRTGDIANLSFLKNDSVDLIYTCHAFEYFDLQQAQKALREWWRVLKKNGILRLAVPDFEALVQLYIKTKDIKKILGPIYGRMSGEQEVIFHRMAYDFTSLSELLIQEGFSHVHRYDWRNTEHANIDDFSQAYFPHMDKENGLLLSLNIEAVK